VKELAGLGEFLDGIEAGPIALVLDGEMGIGRRRFGRRGWRRPPIARTECLSVGRAPTTGALTPTEQRIAELIASRLSYQETADALFISPKAVQSNLSKIYRKLDIRSRAELPARLAARPSSS